MPDIADDSCAHAIRDLDLNMGAGTIHWHCIDCGQVAATMLVQTSLDEAAFTMWAARHGIPERNVKRFLAGR